MQRILFVIALLFLGLTAVHAQVADSLYLYISGDSYHQGVYPLLKGKLRMATSTNGLAWKQIERATPFYTNTLGDSSLYAPSIIRDSAGLYHMVFSLGDGYKGFAHSTSSDLMNWSATRIIPVADTMAGATHVRAPELYYDAQRKRYMVLFSVSNNQRFTETASTSAGGHNYRIYQTITTDFNTWRPVTLLADPEFSATDPTMIKVGKYHYLFYQNATATPSQELNIRTATSVYPTGPYGQASDPIHGPYSAAGPTIAKVGAEWWLYTERRGAQNIGLLKTKDLITWADFSSQVSLPAGFGQGTVLKVSTQQARALGAVE